MLFTRCPFVLVVLAGCLLGANPFYLGTWKIESAVVAPWWTEPSKPDAVERTALVGKTLVVTATGISGPRQVACKGAKYVVKEYPADMLFQGMLGEMHDPAKAAATLGFRGAKWKTVETGCGNELDFHFIDPVTAAFGLNNYIYTLKKH